MKVYYSFVLACLSVPAAIQSDESLRSNSSTVGGKEPGAVLGLNKRLAKASFCKTDGTHRRCQVDVSSLHIEELPDSFDLDIGRDGQVLSCVRHVQTATGIQLQEGWMNSWYGTCGGFSREISMVWRGDKVMATISDDDEICTLRPQANGDNAMECFPRDELPEEDHEIHEEENKEDNQEDNHDRYLRSGDELSHRQLDDGSVLDVMVVWTNEAECEETYGFGVKSCTYDAITEQNMRLLIDLGVSQTNTAFQQSGINTQVRLVHAYRDSTYVEAQWNKIDTALYHLRDRGDGQLEGVHAMRATYGADVVSMILSISGGCGLGFVGPGIDSQFNVMGINCATAKYTFTHELGHNLGCLHDRPAMRQCGQPGYSYGFQDISANVRSIMSLQCNNDCSGRTGTCTRVLQFSSPDYDYQGKRLGDSTHNNALHIRQNIRTAANAFQSVSSPSTPRPTANPTPLPTPEGTTDWSWISEIDVNETQCFSGINTVEVYGSPKPKFMKDIRIGDLVRTSNGFSRVLSFGHVDENRETHFLQIHSDGLGSPLELTPDHMLFVGTPVRARDVKIGDRVGEKTVSSVDFVVRTGIYAPVTESGDLIVSGILSSCFVAPFDASPVLQHYAAKAILSPLRLACYSNFEVCRGAGYTDGRPNVVWKLIRLVRSMRALPTVIQAAVFGFVAALLVLINAAEFLICSKLIAFFVFALGLYLSGGSRRIRSKGAKQMTIGKTG